MLEVIAVTWAFGTFGVWIETVGKDSPLNTFIFAASWPLIVLFFVSAIVVDEAAFFQSRRRRRKSQKPETF